MSKTIKQRTREELYDLFRQGAIPSGADFADFIKSQLNLMDDGIGISENADDPVCFRAHGEKENILDFADTSSNKKWRISGYDEAVSAEGLNITADDQNKLFIKRDNGNIGVGTDQPTAKLHIVQIGANDALRIDDEGNDQTPLVVASDGSVGIGTGSPVAKLHISYSGSGDILRVDDTDGDTTPFIIDDTGNVGIGYSDPKAKLAIDGGVSIGANPDPRIPNSNHPGNSGLYVAGDITVDGTVVFSGTEGIQINAPLSSGSNKITINDNLEVADPKRDGSQGNLTVARDATIGTYNKIYENQNVLTINGRIESGEQQNVLEINKALNINRVTQKVTVNRDLTVTGQTVLGDNSEDVIYLNGAIDTDVVMNEDLTVAKNATINELTVNGNVVIQGVLVGGLPIGTILMYDGASWQDNVTIPGWYAMIAANASYGCHDMTDRFMMGKGSPGAGQMGGENSHTLSIAEMPRHAHNITHGHGNTGVNNTSHCHLFEHFYGNRQDWKADHWGGGWVGYLDNIYTYDENTSHYHSVNNFTGDSSYIGDGVAHENRPQYYSVLYIRRCR